MPSCPGGARPNTAGQDAQVWADRAALALDVASLLSRAAPLFFASIAAQLIDINSICEENLDPPEAFTALDLVELTATIPIFGTIGSTRAAQKAYQWMRYAQFLTYCECTPYTSPPALNCISAPASIPLPAGNVPSVSFPVTIDPVVRNSWGVDGAGLWTYFINATMGNTSAAADSSIRVDAEVAPGVWREVETYFEINFAPGICTGASSRIPTDPPAGDTFALRLRNISSTPTTITNFTYCYCIPATTPKPLPPQPALPDVPSAPTPLCEDIDLCMVIQQLQRSLLNLAAQVSDIQAAVSGRDQLQILQQSPISGEGEVSLVVGTRAVSVELTQIGDEAYTSALGRPRGLMRVGSVRYGSGIGYSHRRFIDADRFDDPVPLGALSVSWQLLPGTAGILKLLG